jgi:ribonuclease G
VIKALDVPEGGVIVRTAAEGASAEDVERDLVFLQRLWKRIQEQAEQAKAPALVYQEAELPLRVVRDLFTDDFERALVDDERAHKRIVGYLKKTSPHMVDRVVRYREKQPLFEAHGVEADVRSTLSRRIDLPSGGYLIFDYAEAFTVIDVNTGRFVGSRSKSSAGRLEDTITKNNLEAVKEVVRQLRLRDIGGIIVIDFIDMANPKNRGTVEEALRSELERDRTKTYVVEISPLGLVEMTRQNVTDGPREVMTRKCSVCAGDGVVLADTTVAVDVERRLRQLATGSRVQAFSVAVNPRTLHLLAGPGGERLAALEAQTRRRFFVERADGTELDHLEVLAQGKLEELRPQGPVSEGDELEVKLVEVGLHDSGAAVAKLDGYEIAVADAARLVGKKVRVRVERALNGTAFATRLDAPAPEHPITAEGEAEKPTRQPRARKAALEAPEAEVEAAEAPVVGEAASAEDEPEAEADGDAQQAPKKRTRRGSRGGRGRKKKTAPAAEGEAAAEAEATEATAETEAAEAEAVEPEQVETAEQAEPPAPPRIHVPDDDLTRSLGDGAVVEAATETETEPEVEVAAAAETDGAEPTKKRTRRGSRGGRGRKKKPSAAESSANGDAAAEAVAEAPEPESASEPEPEPEVAQPAPAGDPDWDYTPMSEWGDEFGGRPR